MRKACALTLAGVVLAGGLARVEAKVYLTQEQALQAAFPAPTRIERKTLYLSEADALAVEKDAGSPLKGRVFSYYIGRKDAVVTGFAYFDTHLVRTLPETIMVLLRPDGKIQRVEVLSFAEPEDYLPREAWKEQFSGKGLDRDLALRRGIRGLTGASLTAEAITSACRRILALHLRAERER